MLEGGYAYNGLVHFWVELRQRLLHHLPVGLGEGIRGLCVAVHVGGEVVRFFGIVPGVGDERRKTATGGL